MKSKWGGRFYGPSQGHFACMFTALVGILWTVPSPSVAQTFQIIHQFVGGDGANPAGELLWFGGAFYGATTAGGQYNTGTVFKVNADGTGFATLKHFTGGDESAPCGDLVCSGDTLYGTTGGGPDFAAGTVFKMGLDGSGYLVLKHFAGSDGWGPKSGLLLDKSVLYGTTFHGGSNVTIYGDGTVYRLNTDGSGYTVLRRFSGGDGRFPTGGLIMDGTTLLGTTTFGGGASAGTLFQMDTDGNGFSQLFSFTFASGFHPQGRLLLAEGSLYGNTSNGGLDPNWGTVFNFARNGSGLGPLKQFTDVDGRNPMGRLIQSGANLFGTTYTGGSSNAGTAYAVSTNGSAFMVLKHFAGTDGSFPNAGLTLLGDSLYGMTRLGGISNLGVIFKLSLELPTITRAPQSQTAEIGSAVGFAVAVQGNPSVLGYRWFFNSTTELAAFNGTNRLVFTNVQVAQAGAYHVVVSNMFGFATSPPAMLAVIPPVTRRLVPCLAIQGPEASLVNLERSDAVSPPNWAPLGSLLLSDSPQLYCDSSIPLPPQRYYRAWNTNTQNPPLIPAIGMVPSIRLTGAVGEILRLDCINQFGPIDAWTTNRHRDVDKYDAMAL